MIGSGFLQKLQGAHLVNALASRGAVAGPASLLNQRPFKSFF